MSTTTRKAREAEKRKASNQKFLKELAGESPAEVTYDDPSSKVKKITSLKEIPAEALLQLSSNSDENTLLMMIYYAAKKGKISNRFRLNSHSKAPKNITGRNSWLLKILHSDLLKKLKEHSLGRWLLQDFTDADERTNGRMNTDCLKPSTASGAAQHWATTASAALLVVVALRLLQLVGCCC